MKAVSNTRLFRSDVTLCTQPDSLPRSQQTEGDGAGEQNKNDFNILDDSTSSLHERTSLAHPSPTAAQHDNGDGKEKKKEKKIKLVFFS